MSSSTIVPPGPRAEPLAGEHDRLHGESALWRALRASGRALPTALVVLLLAAIAYLGHRTEWTFVRSSTSSSATASRPIWCEEHNVPEDECIECRKELVPTVDYGWCSVHGVHNCPLHHPEVAQLKEIPRKDPGLLDRVERALAVNKRAENNSRCLLYLRRVQFASTDAMTKAGVDVGLVEEQPVLESIQANGELRYNEARVASLSSRAPGTVWSVLKHVGDRVTQGELLALVDAARVGKAKADFLQALVRSALAESTFERLSRLSDTVAGRQVVTAESEVRSARVALLSAQQALVNLGLPVNAQEFEGQSEAEIARKIQFIGLPQSLVETIDAASTTANLLPIVAPFDGVVTERKMVPGEVVDDQTSLFVIADPSVMWLMLNVPQEQVHHLKLGQPVRFQPDLHGVESKGTITWISTELDEQTRTVQARAELPNDDGRLRANLFGQGQVVLREETNAVTVPSDAVHWDGSCNVVFVRDKNFFKTGSPKFFHVRTIRPGVTGPAGTEVIVGLMPGEVIATKGSGVLLAQLQKGNLGAGCCGND